MAAPQRPTDTSLLQALDKLSAEIRLVLATIFGIGVLATFAFFMMAQFRMWLFSVAMPARSDRDVLALLAVLGFWVMVITCLRHCQAWLRIALGFRFGLVLSAPAVVAGATTGQRSDEVSRTVRDVDTVTAGLSGELLAVAIQVALVPVMLVLLYFIHWAFMALALGAALLKLGVSLMSHRLVARPLEHANAAHLRGMVAMADACAAAEAVEAMGFLPALVRRWGDDIQGGTHDMVRTHRLLRTAQGISNFVEQTLHISPIVLMAVLALNGVDMGGGVLGIGALLLINAVLHPFSRFVDHLVETVELRAAWDRLARLGEAERRQARMQATYPCPFGRLEVDRLTVMLPGMSYPIIREMSFRIEPGQVLGLSGPVGCGKSTLLRSLIGIQQPSSGGCYLDGHSTAQWDRKDLARHVGWLPQDVGLATGTVADAIARLGVPDMALVLEAAHRCGAHAMIAGLPNGYSTRLSEHALSAGQRQRLALARAIYGRPRLVVLDEPGAWLDAEGLEQLRRLFALLKQDRTSVIFSSHEPGLLEDADHGIALGPIGSLPKAINRNRLAPAGAAR